jgi:zinc transporter ZupT
MNYFNKRNSNIENEDNKKEKKHKENNNNSHENHSHNHSHNHSSNIAISLLGDFIHNITDGMAIGAGFNKNLKLGITLSTSIFFHEIPHEIGDFSYLLKQNMNLSSAILSQLITAIGAFFGVYISFLFGEIYSEKIISFASGAFLYLAINTIMGDLKHSKSFLNIFFEGIAFIFGVYVLDALI